MGVEPGGRDLIQEAGWVGILWGLSRSFGAHTVTIFFEKCKLFFSRIFDPPEKHENPPPPHPPENLSPWDHAQMIERKILFRIALTRALYDQIRP